MFFSRELPVSAEPDVLVCGAGCAGVAAALAAARRGASVMLVEQHGFPGGYITGVVGVSYDGWVDLRSGVPVVGGVVREFVDSSIIDPKPLAADPFDHRFSPSNELRERSENPGRSRIRFDIEAFKRVADRRLAEARVFQLYHTKVVDVITNGDRIVGVVIGNKAGLTVVRPRYVVDATGDADVAAWAGAPFDVSETPQPMTLHFRIAGVELRPTTRDDASAALEEERRAGRLAAYGGPWMGPLNNEQEVYVNACRSPGSGIDPVALSNAEIQGRIDAEIMFRAFKDRVPGFESSYLVATGPIAGVRESRRIRGDKTLTVDDIERSTTQDDAVVLGAWWLDRHPADSSGYHPHVLVRPYDIAYGTMLPLSLANIWVAGRAHSAEPAALASSRVTITCMGMGEAAGAAAATAAIRNGSSRDVDVRSLQQDLISTGSILLEKADAIRAIGDALTVVPESRPR